MRTEWLEAKCPICKCTYSFPRGGYKPKTCNKYDCIHRYAHQRKGGDVNKEEKTINT